MRTKVRHIILLVCLFCARGLCVQDLAQRACLITPLHSNAVTWTYSFFDGSLIFDGNVPITGATARLNLSVFSAYHSFNLFGRTASFLVSLPYGVGNFHGHVVDAETLAYRSRLLPVTFRFFANLIGGPSMSVEEFRKWRQKTILGASLKLVPPTGQYDPTKLVNYRTDRWGLMPELGYSRRWGHWILDAYGGAWFFTTNPEFFSHNQFSPGTNTQSESPVGCFEGHLSYDFKPRLWVSLDCNYWFGGVTTINGVSNPGTLQRNSRVGLTASIPVSRHQSLKLSYSDGAYILYGGTITTFLSLGNTPGLADRTSPRTMKMGQTAVRAQPTAAPALRQTSSQSHHRPACVSLLESKFVTASGQRQLRLPGEIIKTQIH
jgi:Putative MetA-pathway of phenol degradation